MVEYIRVADDRKVKAIYTIIESDLKKNYEWWNDPAVISELEARSDDLKTGKDAGKTWVSVKSDLLDC